MTYTMRGSFPGRGRMKVQDGSGAHPASCRGYR